MSSRSLDFCDVYQVGWEHEASGKFLPATKRRVRFCFGFANREAVEQGLTGSDCRGEEHTVALTWSLTSNKRLVVADGLEIHFSAGKLPDNIFDVSWPIAGGHWLRILAHAVSPFNAKPGFRQFDFFLDGQSFFDMPQIYELGTKNSSYKRFRISENISMSPVRQPAADYYQTPAAARRPRLVSPQPTPERRQYTQEEERQECTQEQRDVKTCYSSDYDSVASPTHTSVSEVSDYQDSLGASTTTMIAPPPTPKALSLVDLFPTYFAN